MLWVVGWRRRLSGFPLLGGHGNRAEASTAGSRQEWAQEVTGCGCPLHWGRLRAKSFRCPSEMSIGFSRRDVLFVSWYKSTHSQLFLSPPKLYLSSSCYKGAHVMLLIPTVVWSDEAQETRSMCLPGPEAVTDCTIPPIHLAAEPTARHPAPGNRLPGHRDWTCAGKCTAQAEAAHWWLRKCSSTKTAFLSDAVSMTFFHYLFYLECWVRGCFDS